jgi:hypothetical protein
MKHHKSINCSNAAKSSGSKIILLIGTFLFLYNPVISQPPEKPTGNIEQQLENYAAGNKDLETEDDSYLQLLYQYKKEPLNLNYATEDDLRELRLLNPLQIQSLLSYRKLLGSLIHIYELQAIPGWSIALIQKLRPYISVAIRTNVLEVFNQRFRSGEHTCLEQDKY